MTLGGGRRRADRFSAFAAGVIGFLLGHEAIVKRQGIIFAKEV
jgi:hypothetical protein